MTKINLLSRKRIADLLGLHGRAKTYELFPAEEWGESIPEGALLDWLNERRGGGQPVLEWLPQLVSDHGLAKSGALTRDGRPLTLRRIRRMCKRVAFPLPHYRLSDRRFAFTPDALDWWQSQLRSGTYVNQRHYQPAH